METPNPFTYDDSAQEVSGSVLSMRLTNSDGTARRVSDLSAPVDIWLPGKPQSIPEATHHTFVTSLSGGDVDMSFHSVEIARNHTALHVILRPARVEDVFDVYFMFQEFPNATHYDWKTTVQCFF